MEKTIALLTTVGVLALAGCAARVDVATEQAALLETDQQWAAAAAAADPERVFPFWTDDAVIQFPGVPAVVGKEAIRAFVLQNRARPGFFMGWEPTTAFVAASGDLGYTVGTFHLTVNDSDGNPITRQGKYTSVWKKQADGSWKCAVESSSFDQRMPGPPPAGAN